MDHQSFAKIKSAFSIVAIRELVIDAKLNSPKHKIWVVHQNSWPSSSHNNNFLVMHFYASVGGATRHTVVVRVCLSVCLSALVLKDGEESAGGKCNIDTTR